MSVWRVGTAAAESATAAPRETTRGASPGPPSTAADTGGLQQIFDRLIKWIPGDTLAIYVPAVTALGASNTEPSLVLLIVMVVITPLFAIGAAFAVGDVTRRVVVAAVLAGLAFAIWSMSVPMSGWQKWDTVANNSAGFAIGAAIAGVLFGYLAEGIMLRVSTTS
jgi:hypothetical protein